VDDYKPFLPTAMLDAGVVSAPEALEAWFVTAAPDDVPSIG